VRESASCVCAEKVREPVPHKAHVLTTGEPAWEALHPTAYRLLHHWEPPLPGTSTPGSLTNCIQGTFTTAPSGSEAEKALNHMHHWLFDNFLNPYPDERGKKQLMKVCVCA